MFGLHRLHTIVLDRPSGSNTRRNASSLNSWAIGIGTLRGFNTPVSRSRNGTVMPRKFGLLDAERAKVSQKENQKYS